MIRRADDHDDCGSKKERVEAHILDEILAFEDLFLFDL